jgi:hypothetical protein
MKKVYLSICLLFILSTSYLNSQSNYIRGYVKCGGQPVKNCKISVYNMNDTLEHYNTYTDGYGVFKIDLKTGVDIENPEKERKLTVQNYPNPFNGYTTIHYSAPSVSDVRIMIFNILGQEVKEFRNIDNSPGEHYINWDGLDNYGKRLSPGMYFCRIKTNNTSAVKKMLYLKNGFGLPFQIAGSRAAVQTNISTETARRPMMKTSETGYCISFYNTGETEPFIQEKEIKNVKPDNNGEMHLEIEKLKAKIVYSCYDSIGKCYKIYRSNIEGTEIKELSSGKEIFIVEGDSCIQGLPQGLRWSPNGKKIVYGDNYNTTGMRITMMDEDGKNKKILTPRREESLRPRWNSKGDKILYNRGSGMLSSSIVDTTGLTREHFLTDNRKLFNGDTIFLSYFNMQWRPDGESIYVLGDSGKSNLKMYVFNLKNKEIVDCISQNIAGASYFEVFPQSSNILAYRMLPYFYTIELYVISMTNNSYVTVTNQNPISAHISNDAKFIIFNLEERDNSTISIKGSVYLAHISDVTKSRKLNIKNGLFHDIYIEK